MAKEKHSESRILELLQKQLAGELSKTESRELYALSEADPFLRDALEGLEMEGDHTGKIKIIRDSIQAGDQRKTRPIIAWSAAAGFLLLLAAAVWLMVETGGGNHESLNSRSPSESIEETSGSPLTGITGREATGTREMPPALSEHDATESSKGEMNARTENQTMQPEADRERSTATLSSEPKPLIAEEDIRRQPSATDDGQQATGIELVVDGVPIEDAAPAAGAHERADQPASITTDQETQPQLQGMDSRNMMRYGNMALPAERLDYGQEQDGQIPPLLHGRVVSNKDSSPISLAEIQLIGRDSFIYTSPEGLFSMPYPIKSSMLQVNAIGYQEKNIEMGELTDLIIKLEPALAGGPLRKEREKVQLESAVTNAGQLAASPKGGWEAFEKYIQENLVIPESAKAAQASGEVELTFTVKKNGKVSDIRIIKSLGHGCDEEAIRLIERGPEWETWNGEAAENVHYTIRFNGE